MKQTQVRPLPAYGVTAALIVLAVFLVLPLAGCASAPPPDNSAAPLKSPSDDRDYRLVTLNNGLRALLISDPDTPKAAASLNVQVGSGDNPPGRGGLAHFLEHMLFLGTEKYPDAAEYERYITEHGGSRNAYTSFEHTNYFFDVDAPHLNGALDRFAQFFVAPNFDAGYVERERNAVEAEYQMGLKSDARRGLDVLQASMNPEHPYSQFAVGSLDSLADRPSSSVREELIAFYQRYYSADVMTLVVLGTEPLNTLESMVRSDFAAVPDRDYAPDAIEASLFSEAQLPMLLKVEPMGTRRQLQVSFPMADYRDQYDAKPMSYVSNLVGHEGEGSLLSQLKAEGLAEGLSAGSGLAWRGGALFSVTVSLTEEGVENYQRVLQLLFAYLDMLREAGPQERIYQEQAAVAELAFRFQEERAPISYVSALSNAMHYYDDGDILRGGYLMQRFDPALIRDALDALRPQRAQAVLTAPGLATDRRSAHYDVPYSQLGPEAVMLARWVGDDEEPALALPAPNPFIAEDLTLRPVAEDNPAVPELRVEQPRKRIWYRQASDFPVPRGALYVNFRSPLTAGSPAQVAAASLYTQVIADALNETYTYPALLAGLGFDIYRHAQGISLRINGYNDRQLSLLHTLLGAIDEQDIAPGRFERIRRDMVLDLQNVIARRPTSQLIDGLRQALLSTEFSDEQLIEALRQIDPEDLAAYGERFWASARAEALLYGNHAPEAVGTLSAELDTLLGDGTGQPASAPRVLALAPDESVLLELDIDHNDAVVGWYLQGAGQSLQDRAAIALTAQIVESGFFQELRTEQQLGYVVSSFPWPQYDVPGLLLLIQSPSHDAAAVQSAMADFLQRSVDAVDRAQFERHRAALVNAILKPHDNLGERAAFYWRSIAYRQWSFTQPQALAEAVRAIDLTQWQAYFREHLLSHPRSLLAVSPGARDALPVGPGESPRRISDPAELRAGHAVYEPSLQPH